MTRTDNPQRLIITEVEGRAVYRRARDHDAIVEVYRAGEPTTPATSDHPGIRLTVRPDGAWTLVLLPSGAGPRQPEITVADGVIGRPAETVGCVTFPHAPHDLGRGVCEGVVPAKGQAPVWDPVAGKWVFAGGQYAKPANNDEADVATKAKISRRLEWGIRTVDGVKVSIAELIWTDEGRSFEVHRVSDDADLTEDGCLDTMPTDEQIRALLSHEPACHKCGAKPNEMTRGCVGCDPDFRAYLADRI